MDAIVLAAGYATRLYPLTVDTPKALLKIGGKPMLEYIVEKILELGDIRRVAVVSNDKFFDQFVRWRDEYVACKNDGKELIVLNDGTDSEQTRLGAIGDIGFAIGRLSIDDDLMVIAADNFFTFNLADLYDFYKRMRADCVIIKRHPDPEAIKSFGVASVDGEGTVVGFEEKPENPKSDLAVYATYIYRRDTLPLIKAYLEEGNIKDAPGNFPAWLYSRKRVVAYAFEGECYDIGTPEAYRDICAKYGN